jgi:hypothetical protein
VLVVVAIVGYLLGIHRAPAPSITAPGEPQRIASGASLLLEYPQSWQAATSAPTFPGLSIEHRLLLAPGGKSADAGLIGGQLPAGGPSPLPVAFLALVHVVPDVEVLTLEHVQAYRFSRLTGYERTLDVYVIPTVGGSPTTLVCYASSGSSAYLEQCERIVATVTLVGQTSYSLSPNAAYASQLGALIGVLDRERLTVRRQIRASIAPARLSALATALADRFASTASSLTALEAPQAATAAQAVLATSMVTAHTAYAELASAAAAEDPTMYSVAEQRVAAAETDVDTGLENFALLGYNHTQ